MPDINEALAYLEQFRTEGGDLTAVAAGIQPLLATGKTPLGLNQWKLTDKPRMEEFNEDNRIIDEQLRNKANLVSPVKYDIEFNKDIAAKQQVYPSYYCKDGFGHVSGNISFLTQDPIPANINTQIAVIPAGFCPLSVHHFAVVHSDNRSLRNAQIGAGWVDSSGRIWVLLPVETSSYFTGSFSYHIPPEQ